MRTQESMERPVSVPRWAARAVTRGWELIHNQTGQRAYLSQGRDWISCQLPLPVSEPSSAEGGALPDEVADRYWRYAHQNERMFLARYTLDTHGGLLLQADCPRGVSPLLLERALEALATYGHRHATDDLLAEGYRLSHNGMNGGHEPISPIATADIGRYLDALRPEGWGLRAEPSEKSWKLSYRGDLRPFDVYLTASQAWAYFQVPVLVGPTIPVLAAHSEARLLFLRYLLRLNDAWYLAKLGISEDGQLLILLEVPIEALDFSLFCLVARTIAAYLNRYGQELEMMSSLTDDPPLFATISRQVGGA